MSRQPNKICTVVVYIEDGIISAVHSDLNVRVLVVDRDSDCVDEDHPHYCAALDGQLHEEEVTINPDSVKQARSYWEC